MHQVQAAPLLLLVVPLFFSASGISSAAPSASPAALRQYCTTCHGNAATAGLNLEKLTAEPDVAANYAHWEKVIQALEKKRMPPPKMPQPSDAERAGAIAWIRANLDDYVQKNAGDPGRVTMRRLTSGEYAYSIRDLTGLDLKLERDLEDSAGGEGFTNFGDVQFMAQEGVERYLELAKRVAAHAVIGAGPLGFYDDPGKSGLELSAISRLQELYHKYGFRAASGEGGRPYGLERYSAAFLACWKYQHRRTLGMPRATLTSLAREAKLNPKFVTHIWSVLQDSAAPYPVSEVVKRFAALPAPRRADLSASVKAAEKGAEGMQNFVFEWPRWLFAAGDLAAGGQGDERALVLTEATLQASPKQHIKFPLRKRGETATIFLSLKSANPVAKDPNLVLWRNPTIRFRGKDRGVGQPKPLRELVDAATSARLGFGKSPEGQSLAAGDFALAGEGIARIEIPLPAGAMGLELSVDAEIVPGPAGDTVLRSVISDSEALTKGRPSWALLADNQAPGYRKWRKGVLDFADRLPQSTHAEPTPADKDPIPPPFNNEYNQPERDRFHAKVKYYRADGFFRDQMIDQADRRALDAAWADLFSSCGYHDAILQFVADKFHASTNGHTVATLTDEDVAAMPAAARSYAQALRTEYAVIQQAESAAEPGHVEEAIRFAERAWRRPLTGTEKQSLRGFYERSRKTEGVDHEKAIRLLLTRILVSPAFLYRLEPSPLTSGVRPLTGWEMASRLSYFLWSSPPDPELRRAAAAGELTNDSGLRKQVQRMLADGKARRMATEFFGQWLGFYRFDQFRGVDSARFPEFTDEVKAGMYDEAVSFFEYLLEKDRPVREMFTADYTFVNEALAKHYGMPEDVAKGAAEAKLVSNAKAYERGGMLRLGAVLTVTSAPLRTSPVKRGDWVLRRVLGTPTPPPPPNAGSIPADDKNFAGQTVRERLASHQRNATCASCHSRIDPMGFPLEAYDPVGRWRTAYADGKPVENASTTLEKTEVAGVDGLLAYLQAHEDQVLKTFSSKLVGYALGRTVLASDRPLIGRMVKAGEEAPLSRLLTEVVLSRQFRNRREGGAQPPQPGATSGLAANVTRKEGGL